VNLPRLPLVEKASGMTIADVLRRKPRIQTLSLDGVLMLCTHYRRVALCQWLSRLDIDGLFTGLANSGWLYAHWLAGNDDTAKRTSRVDPFFDAVVAGAEQAVMATISASRATWHQDREYEDDFCYARALQQLYLGRDADVGPLLSRWKVVSGGDEARFAVCAGLLANAPEDVLSSIEAVVDSILDAVRKRQAEESGDPDAWVTTDRLSLEGLALLRLARRRSMDITLVHIQLPDPLLSATITSLPGPDAWRRVSDPRNQ
jgi:hypothetical protein